MNIPPEVARAQGHHGTKGASHGTKGGRPRLQLTDAERAERRRQQKEAWRRRNGIQPRETLTWEERRERNHRERCGRIDAECRRVWGGVWDNPPGATTAPGEFARRQGVFRRWVRDCLDRGRALSSPVDFVRGHLREERRRQRAEAWGNGPDDGYGDDGAGEALEAAKRKILKRLDREKEIQGLILAALPPAPAPPPGRNQPCPCGSGRKSKRCCGP